MTKTQLLLERIQSINAKQYIKKPDKNFIKQSLELIKPALSKNETNIIKPALKVLSKTDLVAADKNVLVRLKPILIKLINKYEEEFEDESNEDELDDKITFEEVEEILDEKVAKYNKYDEDHPMQGISYSSNKKLWRFQLDKYDVTNKILTKITKYAKGKILPENTKNFTKNRDFRFFIYKNHYFTTYWHNNDPYFDIQHIISVLNLKTSYIKEKYNKYANKISYYLWHKNEFDGYILRELINEKTMYQIILGSNSAFSASFKDDVADILISMRKNGELEITNDKLEKKKPKYNVDIANQLTYHAKPCSYDDAEDMLYVKSLIINGNNIPVSRYMNKHVLYGFIIPLNTNHRDVVIKFGYSEDIIDRIKTLKEEYHSPVYLIKLKQITGKSDESKFHKMLKRTNAYLIEKKVIDNKEKTELYKLAPHLLDFFDNYLNNDVPEDINRKLTPIEKEIVDYVKKQEIIFFNQILRTNCDKSKDNSLRYNILLAAENNNHQQLMKDKDLAMKDKDLAMKDKDLEEKKIETEQMRLKYDNMDKENEQLRLKCAIMEKELEIINARTKSQVGNGHSPNKNIKHNREIVKL